MGHRNASVTAAGDDFGGDMSNRGPLASEIDLLDNQ
jgi:hypothetical protein